MPYWTELASRDDARRAIERQFGAEGAADYADMAWLLTAQKGDFIASLADVSEMIWRAYGRIAPGSNRFSRAIQVVGRDFGFRSYLDDESARAQHLVYIDNLDGRSFVANIRNKVLWKDSFGFGHGEFSHSYQWLAAGLALGWGKRTADLYAGTARRAVEGSKLFVQEGSTVVARRPVLWQWLVDAVNEKSVAGPVAWTADDGTNYRHCFSNSFRFANNVQSFLSTASGWFIMAYAERRNMKLNAHRDRTLAEAHGLIDSVPTLKGEYDALPNARRKREFVQGAIASTEGAERYNDGVAQRASLKDHYRKDVTGKGLVSRPFKLQSHPDDGEIVVSRETYHGLTQDVVKFRHREG